MLNYINQVVASIIIEKYQISLEPRDISSTYTKSDFDADYTIVVHNLSKLLKASPLELGNFIGNYLLTKIKEIDSFFVVGGFLNIKMSNFYWIKSLYNNQLPSNNNPKRIVIEFLSPNTNKPLHLGHIRNVLLGDSLSKILKYNNNEVIKICLYNNRGVHICQSMLAYKLWNDRITPEEKQQKPDHFIGDLYVQYHQNLKKDVESLMQKGLSKEEALKESKLNKQVVDMLNKWEKDDIETVEIWNKLNNWVYNGFETTLKELSIEFDIFQYEHELYKLGKEKILENLSKEIVYKKTDGSVAIDLNESNFDEKILLRADGTSVYITQDIGTIIERYNKYRFDEHIYVVGNEQDYHFKVLKEIIRRFGYSFYDKLHHYSYGMIELPEGKMKSREGKVVDADDLIEEMIQTAKEMTLEKGKMNEIEEDEFNKNIKKIALGALKYHIIKVDPRKNIMFNPQESIDFNGNTGPFIQYTCTRINTLIEKSKLESNKLVIDNYDIEIEKIERTIIKEICKFKEVCEESAKTLNPSLIANYVYNLAKIYNNFYQEIPVLKEENNIKKNLRVFLSKRTLETLKTGLYLLGIEVPSRM